MKTMKICMNTLTITIQTSDDIQCTVTPSNTSCASTLCIEKINNNSACSTNTEVIERAASSCRSDQPSRLLVENIEISDNSVTYTDCDSNLSDCFTTNNLTKVKDNVYRSGQFLQNLSISLINRPPTIPCQKPQSKSVACGQGEPNLINDNNATDTAQLQNSALNAPDKEIVPDKAIHCVDLMHQTKLEKCERTRSEPDVSIDEKVVERNQKQHMQRSPRKFRGLSSSRLEDKTVCELFDPLINLEIRDSMDEEKLQNNLKLCHDSRPISRNNIIQRNNMVGSPNVKDENNGKPSSNNVELQDIFYTKYDNTSDSCEENNEFIEEKSTEQISHERAKNDYSNLNQNDDPYQNSNQARTQKCHSAQFRSRPELFNTNYVKKFDRKAAKRVPVEDPFDEFNNERRKIDKVNRELRNASQKSPPKPVLKRNTNGCVQRNTKNPESNRNARRSLKISEVDFSRNQPAREVHQQAERLSPRFKNKRLESRSRNISDNQQSDNEAFNRVTESTDTFYDMTDEDRNEDNLSDDCNTPDEDNIKTFRPFVEEYINNNSNKSSRELKENDEVIVNDTRRTLMDMFQKNLYRTKSDLHTSISQISSPVSMYSSVTSHQNKTSNRHTGKAKVTEATAKPLAPPYKPRGNSVPIVYQSCYVPRCPDSRMEIEATYAAKYHMYPEPDMSVDQHDE